MRKCPKGDQTELFRIQCGPKWGEETLLSIILILVSDNIAEKAQVHAYLACNLLKINFCRMFQWRTAESFAPFLLFGTRTFKINEEPGRCDSAKRSFTCQSYYIGSDIFYGFTKINELF